MEKKQVSLGTPSKKSALKIMLLGSGELGKEVAIELIRLGVEVIAVDNYKNAPAMQVAQRSIVINMLDPSALRKIIETEKPDRIVPEVEAIATNELVKLEQEGYSVIPTAMAAQITMDREKIRILASETLGIPTARYAFAENFAQLQNAAQEIGFPCFIKPIMSSSGKGQSRCADETELKKSWDISQNSSRSGQGRVIVEEQIKFTSEITLLTIRSASGTVFCDAIGHNQKNGDYVESWQPHPMSNTQLEKAQQIAKKVTGALGGFGLFGVELFLLPDDKVIFSEVSPRPHDTGLVTLITQTQSEFALHARALLGLPVNEIYRHSNGASAAVKSTAALTEPVYSGIEEVLEFPEVDLRIFGKPEANKGRRLGVVLARDFNSTEAAIKKAVHARDKIRITDALH